jgi:L-asparaginase
VQLYDKVARRVHIKPEVITARVDLIRFGIGMDGSLLDAAVGLGAKGVILEAFGGGHLMPAVIPSIEGAIQKGIATVLVSRCFSGELLEDTYSFEGSETHLKKIGMIFASGMSGIKARVALTLALSSGMNMSETREFFEGNRESGG